MKTNHESKPAVHAGLSFASLASINVTDLAHKPASTAAPPPPAAKPQQQRSLRLAAMEAALTFAHLCGLGGRTTKRSATPAPVANSASTASKTTPRPAGASTGPTGTPRPAQARPRVPAAESAHARRLEAARAAAHARGVAAGRLEARQRGQAIFDAAVGLRGATQGLNLPVLAEVAAEPTMSTEQAAALVVRLSSQPRSYAERTARNPNIGAGMPYAGHNPKGSP